MDTLIETRNLTKTYRLKRGLFGKEDIYALKDVSLSVRRSEILGVVGESGSGKSTLGKLILRLEKPSSGEVVFMGKDAFKIGKEYTKEVSVVFQDPRSSLNPRMRVKEIIEEPLIVHGVKNRKDILEEVLQKVQLPLEFLNRKPDDLSGGQRQRVAIARAIALKPKLIVADEPTASLDMSVQQEILKLFENLKHQGIAFLFITHDIRVIDKIADRVAVIYGGMLMELGHKEEILSNPLHPYTRFLLSNVPVKHPKFRREEDFKEVEYTVPQEGCPFAPRCPDYMQECSKSVRRSEFNGRLVSCNLY
ncbi:peptide/nickel transport system ATP-binding protein [Hydrogenivirga caldilitoris]|uniref:Peptide/nickel transport system ATP-binding protein n=1 Tax=Hydrogenivirga caldilitoris TaxID=246264 RepID=A0A497XUQ8_9AQUI|nr:ABC transporter ATP-binding protein [Hydrogenivirga caldilitoris]RLJ70623.1 peptide/nickel transport system ATP-binding protein [Hydrogenivirga caldilitoris]